ncbi:MAG: hemerythrin domain-containing protein [Gallionella sp.]|nr:hemerythrin domain-containing protein [Gallionella sp.]
METAPVWQLDWDESLSMHIPEIDTEHQRFILLVNALNEAIVARMDMKEVKKRMRALQGDAVAHFAHEEKLFREWGYPQAEEHARCHAEIIQALHHIMNIFSDSPMPYECIAASLKVKEALITHLLTEDMKYRDFYLASRK